jgi:hypothetical protein
MRTPDVYQSTTLEQLQALVAHIAAQCPELASRAERAAHILLAGKVASLGGDRYQVTNSEGDGTYTVDQLAETCECKDREHRAPEWKGSKWCKHLLAVLLLRHLGASRPSARLERIARFRPAVTRRPLRKAA